MRCFLIFTIVSVASCAPGLDHSGGGGGITSTLAPFASGPGSGVYAGGHGGYAGGHGGYAGGHGGYAGGHGGYAGGHGGYLGGGSGSFGGSLGGFSGFGPSGAGFTGSGHGGHGYGGGFGGSQGFNGGGGFSGGIIDGHLTAGSINGGLFGGFASGSDGHITAGGGSGGFGGGLDGHLTAGGNIGGGGSIGGQGPIGGAGLIGGSGIAIDGVAGGGYDQGPIVTKDFFFHAAADDIEDEVVSKTINLGPSRKHYRVVFIKAPSQSAKSAALQILQGQNEEKTVIYVLSKKTDGADIHAEIQGYKHTPSKPEVFFIKYKTPEEAIHAQQKIQAQYDSLGGTSRFSDEGISPVTSVIGSVNQGGPVGLAGGHGNGGSAAFIGDSSTGVVGGSNLGGHHGHGVEANLGASLGGHHGHGGVEAGLSGSHGNTHTGDAGYLPPIKK